ncbi:hypothetical protein EHO57_13875 [Leptospira langatensis]|uniref:Uncharacterized protein n=1 Tax=Leptospira langatensis TaxID=2484983 RepID=A0A5R2AT46_9LEPT|nr:hypothetical protein EHO57_13875 [Leptospira langatensis]
MRLSSFSLRSCWSCLESFTVAVISVSPKGRSGVFGLAIFVAFTALAMIPFRILFTVEESI